MATATLGIKQIAIATLAVLVGCSPGSDGPELLATVTAPAEMGPNPRGSYVVVPSNESVARIGPGPIARTIYLNRWGGTYTRGWDNASNNVSSVVSGTSTIPAWSYGDTKWNQMVACVQAMYAPFDATVTDQDPGAAAHIEAVVSGNPQDIGMSPNVGGVSPFTNDCSVIERAITFNFAALYQGNVQAICEVVAQETGHALGMDHEYYCQDPMTYLSGCGAKTFRDFNAQCGENGPRTCACGTARQNSVQHLLAVLGPQSQPGDTTLPNINITQPANGATVQPGFLVRANASDNVGVVRVDFLIDGNLASSDSLAPWEFVSASNLALGAHTVQARAYDQANNMRPVSINVTVATATQCTNNSQCPAGQVCSGNTCIPDMNPQCTTSSQCAANEVCENNSCVPDSGILPGDTGSPCTGNQDCTSGICASNGTEDLCTELCSDSSTCPGAYDCVSAGGGTSVCWPGSGEDGSVITGGCSITRRSSGSTAGLLLLVLGLPLVVRRRRR